MRREHDDYNDEVSLYDDAALLVQEADLLSKSSDCNDWMDAAETIGIAREILESIRTFDTSKLEQRCRELEDSLNVQ